MINLLVESLMSDRGLEEALSTAIAVEMKAGRSVSLSETRGSESTVPLLHLVRQLLGNATGQQLTALKKVCECVCM